MTTPLLELADAANISNNKASNKDKIEWNEKLETDFLKLIWLKKVHIAKYNDDVKVADAWEEFNDCWFKQDGMQEYKHLKIDNSENKKEVMGKDGKIITSS